MEIIIVVDAIIEFVELYSILAKASSGQNQSDCFPQAEKTLPLLLVN